jgi:serine-type D-Ala-D-Ala carboxypeptidase/endopeptidase
MLKTIITTLLCIVTVSASLAQSGLPLNVTESIQARIDNGINPGIVVGIIDAKGPRYYSFGVKSLKSREPITENSIFEIGSITKTFTGILLADRVVRGESKLDDPLQNYLPAGVTAPEKNEATIRLVHLSNHTSGLPYMPGNLKPTNPGNPFADYSEELLYDFLKNYQLTRDIGSKYEYSNYAAGLLGHVLAAKSGISYEQLMVNKISKPLRLENTNITLTPSMKTNLATGYVGDVETGNWDLAALAAAGAIRSSAVDMVKYVSANMGLVKTDLYDAMQLSHRNSRGEQAVPKVGLGWHIQAMGDREIIWHNGGTGGYRTFIGFIKGENLGVVVLSNSNTSIDDIGFHLLNPDAPLKVIEKPIAVDATVLENYVGKYELSPGFILAVSRIENQLKAQLTGQAEFPVFPKSENVFFYRVVEAQLTFTKNTDGIVEALVLEQGGQKIVAKKLK